MTINILTGDCRVSLRTLESESVHSVICSPPFYNLRKYEGSDDNPLIWGNSCCNHDHIWGNKIVYKKGGQGGDKGFTNNVALNTARDGAQTLQQGQFCQHVHDDITTCQCWLGSLGLEPSSDGFIRNLVECFREVRRVLHPTGLLFINLGDSYTGSGKGPSKSLQPNASQLNKIIDTKITQEQEGSLPVKNLQMIPARVALAMQQPYVVPTCVRSEVDRSWLASFFDGEGCIGIRRDTHGRKHEWQDSFCVYTTVGNSDIELLEHCVQLTGVGRIGIKRHASNIDKRGIITRRTHYAWRLDGNPSIEVIKAIYPYLIAKQKQAILAYTMSKLNKNGHRGRGPVGEKGHTVSKEDQSKRELIYDLIKRCNQRELIDLPSWVEEPKQEVEPGWVLRSMLPWVKPGSAMPESVSDRASSAVEYWFQFAKSNDPTFWTHRDGLPGSTTQPLPDYRWLDKAQNNLEVDSEPDGDWQAEVLADGKSKRWRRINLWSSHDYFFDSTAVRVHNLPGNEQRKSWNPGKKFLDVNDRTGRETRNDGLDALATRMNNHISTGRNMRNSDLFMESLQGLILNEEDSVLALVINPSGYSGSHYATFSPKLIEPLVKCSSSQAGVCPTCKYPWTRIVNKGSTAPEPAHRHPSKRLEQGQTGNVDVGNMGFRASKLSGQEMQQWKSEHPDITTGWAPTCDHGLDPVPATILDIFGGAASTLLVADRLGRDGIACELSSVYSEMGQNRVEQDAPLFHGVPIQEKPKRIPDKQAQTATDTQLSASRTYSGFNARWDAKESQDKLKVNDEPFVDPVSGDVYETLPLPMF